MPHDRRPRVVLDLVPLHPGRGGAGGGIWSHASHLAHALDALAPDDVELVCLAHRGLPLETRAARVVRVDVDTRTIAGRLAWVHDALPRWCRAHGAAVLHKLATEIPVARTDARIVATVHDFMAEFYRESLGAPARGLAGRLHATYFALATRRCFAQADAIILLTEAVAAEARRRFPAAAGRFAVVPNGVDHAALARLAARPARDRHADVVRLAYVAAFSPHKGHLHALAGLERLAVRDPGLAARCRLVFRGHVTDAAYHAAVCAAVARSPVSAQVEFAAYAPAASPADVHRGADALLLLSGYEGFGLPPLEAQAAGLPVLCSDLPVFREVLGAGAWLVRPDDPAAVAAALHALLTDRGERERREALGRENARRYSWECTARETLAVYRTLAAARGAGRA